MFEITEQILHFEEIIRRNDAEVDQRPVWSVACTEAVYLSALSDSQIY